MNPVPAGLPPLVRAPGGRAVPQHSRVVRACLPGLRKGLSVSASTSAVHCSVGTRHCPPHCASNYRIPVPDETVRCPQCARKRIKIMHEARNFPCGRSRQQQQVYECDILWRAFHSGTARHCSSGTRSLMAVRLCDEANMSGAARRQWQAAPEVVNRKGARSFCCQRARHRQAGKPASATGKTFTLCSDSAGIFRKIFRDIFRGHRRQYCKKSRTLRCVAAVLPNK